MPPKGWTKNKEDNLNKKKESAEKADKTVTTKTEQTITAEIDDKELEEVPAKNLGSGSKESRERLPKVIVSTYNKEGQLVVKTYTCTTINIHESTSTTLTGGQPTKSALNVHLSVDCDVVEIM